MINVNRLVKLAKKWGKVTSVGRRGITLIKKDLDQYPNKAAVAGRGHFVVYTIDNRRFVVPLACLNNCVFKELLDLSEEEFGLSRDRPITLPCDTVFIKSVISLAQSHASKNQEQALLASIPSVRAHCLTASY